MLADAPYHAGRWALERRVMDQAEVLPAGTHPRVVVTPRQAEPTALDDWYARRGESENWIKDVKTAITADRLGCQRCLANQVRRLFQAAAYWLLASTLRPK